MRGCYLHQGMLDLLVQLRGAIREFVLDIFDKCLHFALHLFQTLAHVQNDFHSGQIHTQVASEVQYQFEPLQIFLSV